MASCNVVNVQCPNGRRQKVKLTAHMTLLQVIQEVCKKQDLNPNLCNLKHQRKTLDSSLTIRFANLPNNAHLELIKSTEEHQHSVKKCVVALQLESGERLVHEFNSDSSLFNILKHWKSQSESLTFDDTLAGVRCIYANQQISGLEKLQTTTLTMIGLNGGRGVIRLIQPTLTIPDNSDNATMKGVEAKSTQQPEALVSQDSPLVQEKPSSEEMDIASCSTSCVSMTSRASEDDTMQCTDAIHETSLNSDRKDKAVQSEARSSQSKRKSGKKDDRMDFGQFESKQSEASKSKASSSHSKRKGGKNDDVIEFEQFECKVNEASQSKAGSIQSKKKDGKNYDAMDIEVGLGGEEITSSVKPDSVTPADMHSPPLECVASTSGASTSRTAAQVEAFSGLGRTLSESGPDEKKARFDSPPSSKTDIEDSQRFRSVESTESGISLPEREPLAFCLGDSGAMSSDDISDDFFEVTVDDLRLMLKDLKSERTAEKPLMTAKMREEREKDKINQYDRVAIRVYFPDQTVLQGFFSPKETVSAVTSFVKENLEQRSTNFYLYTTPPRTILDKPNITLFEAKLFPAAVIHFGSRDSQVSYLHTRLLKEIADFTTAKERVYKYVRSSSSLSTHELETDSPSASQNTVQTNKPQPENTTVSTSVVNQGNERREDTRPSTGKAVPKWFKLGK